jgi:hypothetical protein
MEGCHDGGNALADQIEGALGPGQLSLADRGFFSSDRWLRFSATCAHPLALLTANIAGQALNRENRKRASGRTSSERGKWPTGEAAHDLAIVPSNLRRADTSPRT